MEVHSRDGVVRIVRRPTESWPITDENVASCIEASLEELDERTGDDARQRERFQARLEAQASLPIPDAIPALAGLLVSRDGSFWARVVDPEHFVARQAASNFGGFGGAEPDPTTWDLFDTEGSYLGRVELPARVRPKAVSGRVQLDEFDVEYVVRYEALPVGPGG